MKEIELRVEPLKYVSEKSFSPYGQFFGVERGIPSEDNIFVQCWSKNISVETVNEKLDFCYCKLKKVSGEDMVEAKTRGKAPDWLRNFKGGTTVSIMERHPTTTETFFFLEGDAIFVMAPPDNLKSEPDLSRVRAFLLDSSLSISLWKGTWHWPPIPLYEATRICLVRSGTLDDFDRVDLGIEYKLVI